MTITTFLLMKEIIKINLNNTGLHIKASPVLIINYAKQKISITLINPTNQTKLRAVAQF